MLLWQLAVLLAAPVKYHHAGARACARDNLTAKSTQHLPRGSDDSETRRLLEISVAVSVSACHHAWNLLTGLRGLQHFVAEIDRERRRLKIRPRCGADVVKERAAHA